MNCRIATRWQQRSTKCTAGRGFCYLVTLVSVVRASGPHDTSLPVFLGVIIFVVVIVLLLLCGGTNFRPGRSCLGFQLRVCNQLPAWTWQDLALLDLSFLICKVATLGGPPLPIFQGFSKTLLLKWFSKLWSAKHRGQRNVVEVGYSVIFPVSVSGCLPLSESGLLAFFMGWHRVAASVVPEPCLCL